MISLLPENNTAIDVTVFLKFVQMLYFIWGKK